MKEFCLKKKKSVKVGGPWYQETKGKMKIKYWQLEKLSDPWILLTPQWAGPPYHFGGKPCGAHNVSLFEFAYAYEKYIHV